MKKKLYKDYLQRRQNLNSIYDNHKGVYSTKIINNYKKEINNFSKILERKKITYGFKGNHEMVFFKEFLKYTQTMIVHGRYFSDNLLKCLSPYDGSYFKLVNSVKKNLATPVDTLMGFIILRSWLEEFTLNLFYLFKSKNLIKTKKWSELFLLIHKVNYYGFEDEVSYNFGKKQKKFKKYLSLILKKNKKLHIADLIKYVCSQKDLIDKGDAKNFKEIYESKISLSEKLFLKNLVSTNTNYSMKPIKSYYDKLSSHLHPNNLLTRNSLLTSVSRIRKNDVLPYLKTNRDIDLISKCHDYITDTSEILFKETIELNNFFYKNLMEKSFALGFRNSVENKIFKNLNS
jgi:hypothetical protein